MAKKKKEKKQVEYNYYQFNNIFVINLQMIFTLIDVNKGQYLYII